MYSEDSQWMLPHGLRMLVLRNMLVSFFLKKKILGDVIRNKLHIIIVLICIPLSSTKAQLWICVYGLFESLLELLMPLIFLFRSWCFSYLEDFINYGYYLF